MTRRRTAWNLRRRFGGSPRRSAVTSIMYRGKVINVTYRSGSGFESEIVGDGTVYPGPSRDAAIAKAKRVIDAMGGD